jgi:hypothetical protein
MKDFLSILLVWWLVATGSPIYADTTVVGGGGGVSTASNCDQAAYYPIGKLCQDTDDGKLYKGTGAAVVEIASADLTAPGPIGGITPAAGTFTTLGAGGGGFAVDADGDVTAKSVTVSKVSDTAGSSLLYEANSTDTNGVGWKGPASRASDLYLQFSNSDPAANQIMLFPAPTTGTATASWVTVPGGTPVGGTLGATANVIPKSSGTGAQTLAASGISEDGTDVQLTALNLITSGTITGRIPAVDGGAADLNLSAAQVSGTTIRNTGQGPNNRNHTLPVAAAGMSFLGVVGEAQAASYFRFTAATSPTPDDFMCLDGTCGKTYVSIAAPTQGAQVTCHTEQIASTGIATGAALAIGTTNTAVANGAFTFDIAGTGYAKAATAAGTAPGNDVIPQNKYGAVAFDIGVNGTIDAIEATDNATGYDSAALAIAGLPAAEAAHVRMGTVTAMKSDGNFTFGTTALDAGSTTVAYTSTAAYTKPYNWICNKSVGTWVTN